MVWIGLLLLRTIYICASFLTSCVGRNEELLENHPQVAARFEGIVVTMCILFKVLILDSWSQSFDAVNDAAHKAYAIFFVVYLLITHLAV